MQQNAQTISSDTAENNVNQRLLATSGFSASEDANDNVQLNSVMSDLSRLSKSFVNSFQNLEGQVEQLNGQLQSASEQRSEAIEEKQKLIDENQTITNRLRNLLAILPSGVVVLDGKGVVRDCNAVAIDILGRPLFGEAWFDVINRAFLPQADDGHQVSLKDGRKIHIETRALDSEPGQMIVLTDLTKTRHLQARLSQQQKLSSMGKMVASLAHQIRTPLSAALLYGAHLNNDSLSDEKKDLFSEQLVERLKFMDRQISDMLNFVKGEREQKSSIEVNEIIKALKLSCHSFIERVHFDIDKTIEHTTIVSDKDALVGAIMNLINNAVEASAQDQAVEVFFSLKELNRLRIQVVDRGTGIVDEVKEKILEPFFTTKSTGNGLGLAIVHGVVIDHGGTISIDSQPNEGSQFEISLPVNRLRNESNLTPEGINRRANIDSVEGVIHE
jgi:two-component system sensor histidine kinase FlrB